jgi:phage shock protein B
MDLTEEDSMITVELLMAFALIVGLLGIFTIAALRIVMGSSSNRKGAGDSEEARMVQEVFHGLLKLEERVESLETLLMDKQRKGKGL